MRTINQSSFEAYKMLYPDDTRLQKLTLQELYRELCGEGSVTWSSVAFDDGETPFDQIENPGEDRHKHNDDPDHDHNYAYPGFHHETNLDEPYLESLSPCALGIGYVVFDCLCLFLGAASLRNSLTPKAASDMAVAAEPVANQITKYVKTISAADSSKTDVAAAVFGVISTIYSSGCLGAVLSAFLYTLSWYQAVLYGATALGTIMAAVATDGAAEIGIIVVELATAGFLVADSVKCADACS